MSKYEELQKYLKSHGTITDLQCAASMSKPPKDMPKEKVTFLRKHLFRQCIMTQCKKDPELQALMIAASKELLIEKLWVDSDFENFEKFEPTEQQKIAMGIAELLFGGLFEGHI